MLLSNDTAEFTYNRMYFFSDVKCGTLHCMGGLERPVPEGEVTHINTQVRVTHSPSSTPR
jgi:hypothetical protein